MAAAWWSQEETIPKVALYPVINGNSRINGAVNQENIYK